MFKKAKKKAIYRQKLSHKTGQGAHPVAHRGDEMYPTSPKAVVTLLSVEQFSGTIWEPGCGFGNIVKVLRDRGHTVVASDLHDYGCPDSTAGVDFLKVPRSPKGVTAIIGNPPFKDAEAWITHGLSLVPRVVFLLRILFLQAEEREELFAHEQLARIHVFTHRFGDMHRAGWDGPKASPSMSLAWFCFERGHQGPPILDWISAKRATSAFGSGAIL